MDKGKKVQKWKTEIVEKLVALMEKYAVLAAAELHKVRSSQIHAMRRKLRGRVEMMVVKKTLTNKAAEKIEDKRKGLTEFLDKVQGPFILLFTDIDPFKLLLILNKSKIKVAAKGGDLATSDIIIPAGNTGIPPGPVISEFGEVKVPTKIESGSIWISNDTVVAKKGDVIPSKLGSLLSRLGIKPIEVGLSLFAAYENEAIFDKDALTIDVDSISKGVQEAAAQALNLSVKATIPTKEALPLIVSKAHREAFAVARASQYITSETASSILGKAQIQALTLKSKIDTSKS